MIAGKLWTTITESKYPWEREALDFVRSRLPAHEPYRAWANFEFIADDGSINEVDLLVFTPQGFFLVEIKSRPGRLTGDVGTWTWITDGKPITTDNPLISTNLKAKKLASLLQRQRAFKSKGRLPFLEPLVFCSGQGLQCDLEGNARYHVCLRDREATDDRKARPGILSFGIEGESRFSRRNYMELLSVFTSPPLVRVLHGRREIGLLDQLSLLGRHEGVRVVLLGGRAWAISSIDWTKRIAYVTPVTAHT